MDDRTKVPDGSMLGCRGSAGRSSGCPYGVEGLIRVRTECVDDGIGSFLWRRARLDAPSEQAFRIVVSHMPRFARPWCVVGVRLVWLVGNAVKHTEKEIACQLPARANAGLPL